MFWGSHIDLSVVRQNAALCGNGLNEARSGKRRLSASLYHVYHPPSHHKERIGKVHFLSNNRLINEVKLYFDMKKKFKIANRFGPCQPARTAQADMGRNFSQTHEAPFHRAWLKILA